MISEEKSEKLQKIKIQIAHEKAKEKNMVRYNFEIKRRKIKYIY